MKINLKNSENFQAIQVSTFKKGEVILAYRKYEGDKKAHLSAVAYTEPFKVNRFQGLSQVMTGL